MIAGHKCRGDRGFVSRRIKPARLAFQAM